MSKAFTREIEDGEEDIPEDEPKAPRGKNYLTPAGYARLRAELKGLVEVERPEVVRTVSWAASNGDRSENGDYIYGKRRLREIDRRVRYLMKRLEIVEVVDPRDQEQERIFFGATVTYGGAGGAKRTVSIVGVDEVDPLRGRVSWVSPIAPAGTEELEVLEIRYDELT
ncbi:MAG: transcription elongation factor GreB [Betaproteobacteria bacterium]|nr:transcription elongation factor GreB [Betaproteobacteria bacterium]